MSESVAWNLMCSLPAERFLAVAPRLPALHRGGRDGVVRPVLGGTAEQVHTLAATHPDAAAHLVAGLPDTEVTRLSDAVLTTTHKGLRVEVDGARERARVLDAAVSSEEILARWASVLDRTGPVGTWSTRADAVAERRDLAMAIARGPVSVPASILVELVRANPATSAWLARRTDADYTGLGPDASQLSGDIAHAVAAHPSTPTLARLALIDGEASHTALAHSDPADVLDYVLTGATVAINAIAVAVHAARASGPDALAALSRACPHVDVEELLASRPDSPRPLPGPGPETPVAHLLRHLPVWLGHDDLTAQEQRWVREHLVRAPVLLRAFAATWVRSLDLRDADSADEVSAWLRGLARPTRAALADAALGHPHLPVFLPNAPASWRGEEPYQRAVAAHLAERLDDDGLVTALTLLPGWQGSLGELIDAARALA